MSRQVAVARRLCRCLLSSVHIPAASRSVLPQTCIPNKYYARGCELRKGAVFITCGSVIPTRRPWTTWLPLAFVLGVSMIKEAVEDYKRHKADNEINNRKVRVLNPETKQFEDRRWMDVRVGQVLQVRWAGAGRGSWVLWGALRVWRTGGWMDVRVGQVLEVRWAGAGAGRGSWVLWGQTSKGRRCVCARVGGVYTTVLWVKANRFEHKAYSCACLRCWGRGPGCSLHREVQYRTLFHVYRRNTC